ncbi:MAG: transglutaminase domain-containing protein [Polyangiaceae bacterium]
MVEPGRPPAKSPKRSAGALVGVLAVLLLKALFWVFAIALPIVGAWIMSSLIAYANGPVWLAFVALFTLFPILPGAWEGISAVVRGRRKAPGERILTLGDRLLLRTLALNVLFVGGLVLAAPETGVRALLARGDWMLDGSTSPGAARAREILFAIADRFEWIYRAAHDKSYEEGNGEAKRKDDSGKEAVRVERSLERDAREDAEPTHGESREAPKGDAEPAKSAEIPIGGGHSWPEAEVIDPLTIGLEPASPEAVGAALREGAPDVFRRTKAIHDWISDRVVYDVDAFFSNKFPPQDAGTVFRTHVGVCAGYSNLFVAIAKAAGIEAVVVVGDAKGAGGEVDGRGHAWNAVKLEGAWYFVDTTWDAGSVGDDRRFTKQFRTTYLFTPPEIFRADHFPRDEKWQLTTPISRGEFMRLPQMEPAFFQRGMKLVSPTRSQTTVGARATVTVENPNGQFMMAGFFPKGGHGVPERCEVTGRSTLEATCVFPGKGEYRVVLFGAAEKYGRYWSMGELQFLSDP